MNGNPIKATVAFVPREQFATTRRCLELLYERTSEPFELVCIDGGSPPDVSDYLASAAREKGFTLIRTENFLTPNQARNLALPFVRTPYVVFVDNDVLVSDGWLGALVECAEETGAWAVGPLYFEFEPEGRRVHMFGGEVEIRPTDDGRLDYYERHACAHELLQDVEEKLTRKRTDLIEFHTVLVRTSAFSAIGPLDESLMCNSDHGDFCLAIRAQGGPIFVEPKSRITYAPPKVLSAEDRRFFELRWSEARASATAQRLKEKHGVDPDAPGMRCARYWVSHHRRYGLPWINRVKRRLGSKLGNRLERKIVVPIENWLNKRKFPSEKFGRLETADAHVVHEPSPGTSRYAA